MSRPRGIMPRMAVLVVAIVVALCFAVTNGFHDSANAVAGLVATRAARPGQALALTSVCHMIGPLLVGTAVAATVGGIVQLDGDELFAVVGAAVTAAATWNVVTWRRGLPSSSSHALVGGLVGAALVTGGASAVNWGGFHGLRPFGVVGTLASLAVSPLLGFAVAAMVSRSARRVLRNATIRFEQPIIRSELVAASGLAFAQGANDAPKTMGVITLLLLATGHLSTFDVPFWVAVAAAACLTLGTMIGGWRVARTLGRGVYRLRPLDALSSQTTSAGVVLGAALFGAPVSPTHTVASSVVGVGASQRRRHVRWRIVKGILLGWCVTLPVAAMLAIIVLPLWKAVS
jgi:PiT family inorganic phosphate transporter